jgi:hypothetical protein
VRGLDEDTSDTNYGELNATAACQRGAELCRLRREDQHSWRTSINTLERSSPCQSGLRECERAATEGRRFAELRRCGKRPDRAALRRFHKCLGPQTAGAWCARSSYTMASCISERSVTPAKSGRRRLTLGGKPESCRVGRDRQRIRALEDRPTAAAVRFLGAVCP